MRVADLAAVGDVDAVDAHAAARRRDVAGLRELLDLLVLGEPRLAGEARDHVVEADAGNDGHAVPLVEAVVGDPVAELLEARRGELMVAALGLLHGQDVDVVALEQPGHPLETGAGGIDVPDANTHAATVPGGAGAGNKRGAAAVGRGDRGA